MDDLASVAGEVCSTGGDGFTAGNVTFVQVYEAGHVVLFGQHEAALVSSHFPSCSFPMLFLLSLLHGACMLGMCCIPENSCRFALCVTEH